MVLRILLSNGSESSEGGSSARPGRVDVCFVHCFDFRSKNVEDDAQSGGLFVGVVVRSSRAVPSVRVRPKKLSVRKVVRPKNPQSTYLALSAVVSGDPGNPYLVPVLRKCNPLYPYV